MEAVSLKMLLENMLQMGENEAVSMHTGQYLCHSAHEIPWSVDIEGWSAWHEDTVLFGVEPACNLNNDSNTQQQHWKVAWDGDK